MPKYFTEQDTFRGKALRKAGTEFYVEQPLKKPLPGYIKLVAGNEGDELTPQQKAARTRAENKAKEEAEQAKKDKKSKADSDAKEIQEVTGANDTKGDGDITIM